MPILAAWREGIRGTADRGIGNIRIRFTPGRRAVDCFSNGQIKIKANTQAGVPRRLGSPG